MSDENSFEQQAQPDYSFGKRLASARNALNLSREDVSKELRLGIDIVTALEEEDCQKLAAPIFVNGYLRNYARLLKIPVEPLLAAYGQIQIETPAIISDAARKPKPAYSKLLVRTASLLIVLVLVAGVISWLQDQDFEFPPVLSLTEQAPVAEPVTPSVVLPPLVEQAEIDKPLIEENTVLPIVEPTVVPPVEAVIEPAPEKPPVVKVKNEALITVKEDSWVEVSDNDGKRLIYDLLRADKEYVVSGNTPFKVFLGNAKGVRIKYNGEPVNVEQYIRGNLARFELGAVGE